ncbi:MAG: hypothetical protein QNL33_09520, partial [Akkermansiaceae bacterium]
YAPIKILSAKSELTSDGKATLTWELDPKTTPQFGYTITARDQGGQEILKMEAKEAHIRQVTLALPKSPQPLSIEIRCHDIFDNESEVALAK